MGRKEDLIALTDDLVKSSSDIEGAAVISLDGLVMAASLSGKMDEVRVGATAAAMLGLSKRTANQLERGGVHQTLIQAEKGNIIITSAGTKAVFVGLTPSDVTLGMVFLEAREAAEKVAAILG